jgi:NADH:ubiquinone oxidoreductase subunit 2 (subunit N)
MTVVPFLLVGATAGSLSLLLRHSRSISGVVAVVGLIVMSVTAAGIDPTTTVDVGGARLVASEWLRLYAVLGSVVGLLLVVVGLTTLRERDVPGAIALGLAGAVLALAAVDPGVAVIAATAGALAVVIVAVPVRASAEAEAVGTRELRALAIAATLAIVATAWIARPLDGLVAAPVLLGAVYVAFAIAVSIRFGAIPFHLWAARIADSAPGVALPLLLAWGPAAFAAVALAWIDRSVAPVVPLPAEQGLIAAIGALSVVLGITAAAIQDDLEHVVGYTIIADAGFVILALGVLDPAIREPARTWLLVLVTVRSALGAWVVAIQGAFGTRRIRDLAGWARRAPGLGFALGVIAIAAVGWPGLATWEARATIASLALPAPLAIIVTAAPIAGVVVYARILLVGLAPQLAAVEVGRGERPGWPEARSTRPVTGRVAIDRAIDGLGARTGGRADLVWSLPAAIRWNRVPIGSVVVLVLAGLGMTVAGGGLGVRAAAAVRAPLEAEPAGTAGVTFEPIGPGGVVAAPSSGDEPNAAGSVEP